MIKSLFIKNFALIDELEVHFEAGLNILTGQTGAGKSIIIGALNMILGERADTDVIRYGADKAIAEAVIAAGPGEWLQQFLEENAVEYRDELILRREIRQSGSRAFINDTPVNISVLKEAGNHLVDLHGQHDHQQLLDEDNHLEVIDQFESVQPALKAYSKEYQKMITLQKELRNLEKREAGLREKTELYQFQVKEIEDARLDIDEEEALIAEMNLLDNAEELDQKASAIANIDDTADVGLIEMLNEIKLNLEDLARIEPDFETYLQEVTTARISLQETIQFAERYRSSIEFNPQRLEELRKRQSELNRIQKKYMKSIGEILAYYKEIKNELSNAENLDAEKGHLITEIEKQGEKVKQRAVTLFRERERVGEKLSEDIAGSLRELGIRHGKFKARISWIESSSGWFEQDGKKIGCTAGGCNVVQFYISTNKGEEPKPLARIASGGEISRVMLSLKSILAKEHHLPVMIFDEIDTGISGSISEKVGRVMRALSEHCQIIAITHQPQIASQAHKHYKVEKNEKNERTTTRILPLTGEEHIHEVASLMSGEEITDSALRSARELIEQSRARN